MPSCPSIRPFLDISANLGKLFHSNLPGWDPTNIILPEIVKLVKPFKLNKPCNCLW